MFTIWGLGLSLSWGWQGEDTGTGSMVQRVGVLHTGQHWTVMHIILGVSPVSVGPCMCAVRTQVTEDRPLKKCNCTTSTAQDQPSAGQGNIELSLERGRGAIFFPYHWRVRLSVYSNFATWMKTNSPALHVRVYVYMYSTCTCTCTHTPTLHTRANCIHVEIVYCTLLCLEVMVSEEREWQKRENDTGLAPRLHHLLPTLKTRKYNTRNKHMRQDLKHFDDESAKCIDCYHAATKNTAE